jgi:ribonuclease D
MTYWDRPAAIRDRFAFYRQQPVLWLDTEVADSFSSQPRLSLIQVAPASDPEAAEVLDVLGQPDIVAEFVTQIMAEKSIEKVFHSADFDLRFLDKQRSTNVTCTLRLARSLPKNLLPVTNHKLQTLAEYFLPHTRVDKTEQRSNWAQRPLSEKQVHYAGMDVVYLSHVHRGLLAIQTLAQTAKLSWAELDLPALSRRYRALEDTLRPLLAERDQLKEQLQARLADQAEPETEDYRLVSQQRRSKKCSLRQLAELAQAADWDLTIPLSQEMQQQLGADLDRLTITTETATVQSLRAKF